MATRKRKEIPVEESDDEDIEESTWVPNKEFVHIKRDNYSLVDLINYDYLSPGLIIRAYKDVNRGMGFCADSHFREIDLSQEGTGEFTSTSGKSFPFVNKSIAFKSKNFSRKKANKPESNKYWTYEVNGETLSHKQFEEHIFQKSLEREKEQQKRTMTHSRESKLVEKLHRSKKKVLKYKQKIKRQKVEIQSIKERAPTAAPATINNVTFPFGAIKGFQLPWENLVPPQQVATQQHSTQNA